MSLENEPQRNYSPILELIYKDADESVKFLRDDINSINTRLVLLIGFNANFVTLLSGLPNQTIVTIDVKEITERFILYCPHAGQVLEKLLILVNWCLSIISPIVTILPILSIILAICGILPSPIEVVILPGKMLEKSKDGNEKEFREGVILTRNATVEKLQEVIHRKAQKLKYALLTLGIAAVMLAFNIFAGVG